MSETRTGPAFPGYSAGQRVKVKEDPTRRTSVFCQVHGGKEGTINHVGTYFLWVKLDGTDAELPLYDTELVGG